jgi:hypothetical protein
VRRREGCAIKFSATRNFLSLPCFTQPNTQPLRCQSPRRPGPCWKLVDAHTQLLERSSLRCYTAALPALTSGFWINNGWTALELQTLALSLPGQRVLLHPPQPTDTTLHCPEGPLTVIALHNCHPWVVFGIYTIDPSLTLTRVRILGQTTKNAEVLAPAVNC